MASLPKSVKDDLIFQLGSPWASVALECDGYRVDLQVQRGKGLSYRVMTYVNGVWKGAWFDAKASYPEQRFARRCERPLNSKKQRESIMKAAPAFGRKGSPDRKAWEARADATYAYIDPTFASGRAAINHMLCVSEVVRVIPAHERLAPAEIDKKES